MSDAPKFVWIDGHGSIDTYDDGSGVIPYVRRDPATLAELPEVQALVAAAYRRAADACKAVATARDDQIKLGAGVPAHEVDVMQQTRWRAGKVQAEILAKTILALIDLPEEAGNE
jgi:hypothetical protein